MQFDADRGSLERFYFISSSPERRQRMEAFCADYSGRLSQVPFEKLNVSDRADYILFKNQLSGWLEELKKEQVEYDTVRKWLPFANSIYPIERPRRGEVGQLKFCACRRAASGVMKLYNESIEFIKSHDLVTIPPIAEETCRMSMMAPERQLVSPFSLGGRDHHIISNQYAGRSG